MFYLRNFILLPEDKLNACLKQNILEEALPELFMRLE